VWFIYLLPRLLAVYRVRCAGDTTIIYLYRYIVNSYIDMLYSLDMPKIPRKLKRIGKFFRLRQDHADYIEQVAETRKITQNDVLDELIVIGIDRSKSVKEQ
jgi:single-stranded DNA-specific DHH superfamily exonuclease